MQQEAESLEALGLFGTFSRNLGIPICLWNGEPRGSLIRTFQGVDTAGLTCELTPTLELAAKYQEQVANRADAALTMDSALGA